MDTARESAPRSESAQVSPNTIPLPVPQPNTCKGEWRLAPSAEPGLYKSGQCGVEGSGAGGMRAGPGHQVLWLCGKGGPCLVMTEKEVVTLGDSGCPCDPGQVGLLLCLIPVKPIFYSGMLGSLPSCLLPFVPHCPPWHLKIGLASEWCVGKSQNIVPSATSWGPHEKAPAWSSPFFTSVFLGLQWRPQPLSQSLGISCVVKAKAYVF